MLRYRSRAFWLVVVGLVLLPLFGTKLPVQEKTSDWTQFRGSGGRGTRAAKRLPLT